MSRARAKSASSNGTDSSLGAVKPTDAELAVLQVLWRRGPSTVREIHQELGPSSGFSTIQKFLELLTKKGLVEVERQVYAFVYKARCSEEEIQQSLVSALLKKAFAGSPSRMINQLFASKKPSADDLATIKRLWDEHKKT